MDNTSNSSIEESKLVAKYIKSGFRVRTETKESIFFVFNLFRKIKKKIKIIKAPQKTEKERIDVREEPKKVVQRLSGPK